MMNVARSRVESSVYENIRYDRLAYELRLTYAPSPSIIAES